MMKSISQRMKALKLALLQTLRRAFSQSSIEQILEKEINATHFNDIINDFKAPRRYIR